MPWEQAKETKTEVPREIPVCASAFGGAGCSECADLAFFERMRAEPRGAEGHSSADSSSQQAGTQLEESESRK